MATKKTGIALVGSTIVDELAPVLSPGQLSYVDAQKFVDKEELAGEEVRYSVGGMATNVGVDLAKIDGGYPVAVFGKIGNDHRADIIRRILTDNHIPADTLQVSAEYETSCTEVLHIRLDQGRTERIYRQTLGAMGSFNVEDIDFNRLADFKIAMFGYGLLLPQLDKPDAEFGTVMGRVLARVQKSGVLTALDFVSPGPENSFKFARYRRTLAFVDICCINDDQACAITSYPDPRLACIALVKELGAGLAVVHCGAQGPNYAFTKKNGLVTQSNFPVPENEYKGNAGAGDAFSAGFLHGIHQDWNIGKCVKFAAAAAAISLGDVSCTGAMQKEEYILDYMNK